MREVEFDPNWRFDTFKVKDFDKGVSLKAVRSKPSLNYYFTRTQDVISAVPKNPDSESIAVNFANQEKRQIDHDACYVYRELWIFPRLDQQEQSKFSEGNTKHHEWEQQHAQSHFKVGYPNRFTENGDEKRVEEFNREMRALVTRQLTHSHPAMVASMTQFYVAILGLIKQEADDEAARVKLRIDQMMFENEIRNRPKPDPYNEARDSNIQAIKNILLNSEDFKKQRYEQQLIRSICNKFVNKYFDCLGGLEFCRENPSSNFVKPKVDKQLLQELQELGRQTIEEEKERDRLAKLNFTSEMDMKASRDPHFSTVQQGGNPYNTSAKRPFRIKSSGCSVFKQMEKDRIMQEDIARQKNLEYLSKMTKTYDVYGKQRKPLEPVFGMFKGAPEYEYNEKAIEVEAPTDKRVKISSTANRAYLLAPSVDEMRNAGTHEKLMKTVDIGNPLKEIEKRGKLMPTSKMESKERDFIVYPHSLDFGVVRPGNCYKAEIVLINDNYFLQRVKVLPPSDPNIKATVSQTGPIAMGQERRVTVYLDTEKLEEGEVDTELFIMSKYRKYTIPIKAVLGPNVEDHQPGNTTKSRRDTGSNLKKIITVETRHGLGMKPDDLASKGGMPAGFNEVHKKYLSLFGVQEVGRAEMEQVKTKAFGTLVLPLGDGTGTLTQEYLQKVNFDRDYEIKPEVKPK